MRDTKRPLGVLQAVVRVAMIPELVQGLLVAGAVVVGLVAAAVVHQDDHFAVVHDALATVHAGVVGHATALVT